MLSKVSVKEVFINIIFKTCRQFLGASLPDPTGTPTLDPLVCPPVKNPAGDHAVTIWECNTALVAMTLVSYQCCSVWLCVAVAVKSDSGDAQVRTTARRLAQNSARRRSTATTTDKGRLWVCRVRLQYIISLLLNCSSSEAGLSTLLSTVYSLQLVMFSNIAHTITRNSSTNILQEAQLSQRPHCKVRHSFRQK